MNRVDCGSASLPVPTIQTFICPIVRLWSRDRRVSIYVS